MIKHLSKFKGHLKYFGRQLSSEYFTTLWRTFWIHIRNKTHYIQSHTSQKEN